MCQNLIFKYNMIPIQQIKWNKIPSKKKWYYFCIFIFSIGTCLPWLIWAAIRRPYRFRANYQLSCTSEPIIQFKGLAVPCVCSTALDSWVFDHYKVQNYLNVKIYRLEIAAMVGHFRWKRLRYLPWTS